ncbi:regulator [Vibrio xuii]|nr:regulator [Vibrio xuii]
MKYHEMTKNYIFREFECGLSIEQTAELCFKSVRTIKEWDKGSVIPKECKRLMRLYSRFELSDEYGWRGFRMVGNRMELPTGQRVSPQEILTGVALLQINSELEIKINAQLMKTARALSLLMNKRR